MISQKEATKYASKLYDKIGAWHEKLRDGDKKIDGEVLTRLFRALPANLKDKKVLDAGGGSGVFSQMLLEKGVKEVVCIDVSEKMLQFARRRKTSNNLKQLKILKRDLSETKLKNNHFDIIFAIYSLPYISELDKTFKEFARVLKVGGLVFVASDFYNIKKDNLRGTQIKYMLGDIKMAGILHTKEDYTETAKNAGFSIKDFFVVEKAHGLKIDPSYKHKKLVKQFTFGSLLQKRKSPPSVRRSGDEPRRERP